MRSVIVHATRRLFDGFFKVDEAEISFERFDGSMAGPVKRLSFERGDSVAAVIHNVESGKLVFVEQFKYPTYKHGTGWLMETVAGKIEDGETAEDALRREVLEEVGYRVDSLEHVATFYVSPGGSSERVLLYYAEVRDADKVAAGGGAPSEAEDIRTLELTPAELFDLERDGGIHDAKTLIGAQWLRERLGTPQRAGG